MAEVTGVRALSLDALRERTSEKWREYPADVLPLFVAETDFALAPAATRALERAVRTGDTGYVASRTPLAEAYAAFAQRRFGWNVDPERMRSTADVSMGIVEILRRVTSPGDRVIVTTPVYPPLRRLRTLPHRSTRQSCPTRSTRRSRSRMPVSRPS